MSIWGAGQGWTLRTPQLRKVIQEDQAPLRSIVRLFAKKKKGGVGGGWDVAQLVANQRTNPAFNPHRCRKPGLEEHTYNSRAWRQKEKDQQSKVYFGYITNLRCMRPYLKQTKTVSK